MITMITPKKKKGAISALPEIILMIFALALGVMLFSIVFKFGAGVKNSFIEDQLDGEPAFVSENLARLAQDCWKLNKRGKSPENDNCFTLKIKSTGNVTESDFNRYLDCNYLPNNFLNLENKTHHKCGKKDKVYWEIYNKDTEIKISYSASRRRIEIVEIDAVCIGACCIEKCHERCRDMNRKCEEMHSKCDGEECDKFHTECTKIAKYVCDNCKDTCDF
ncbi:MAG: hypothetical protein U9Q92_07810 [archaeon]|nr:hypothetical protein [archaeon]